MRKKIIGLVIIIIGIIVVSAFITAFDQTTTENVVIQEQEFKAKEGYTVVDKQLMLTNDGENFLINDELVPEEIRIKPQTNLNVEVVNNSNYPTSVHFHGINDTSQMDGVAGITQDPIEPGETFTYSFNIDEPGTYMYHAHLDSANQVNNENLYGGLVVEDAQAVNSDMLIYNTNIDNVGSHHNANLTYSDVLVNGQASGSLAVDNDDNIILNVANLSSAPISINFGQDVKYKINSIDANPATSKWYSNNSIIVPTAQRFIVEIENPKHSFQISTSMVDRNNATYDVIYKGQNDIEEQDFNTGSPAVSMMDDVEQAILAPDAISIYQMVETNTDLEVKDKPVDVKQDMVLDMNNGMWTINNLGFPDTDKITVNEGDVVELTLSNTSHMGENHPFHLHGHKFQVVEYNGTPVEKNLVLDTVNVQPGDEVTIRLNADNPGIWAFHCHNLVHAGLGMMTTFEYAGYSSNVEATASE